MPALVTVVVPIFDVAAYLADCLDSLAVQTHGELEVVLVDDGSTDGSGGIAARYPGRDRRFRLVRQDNRGLGAARNTGLDLGTGDYLMFVDSDDVLAPYAVEVLLGALERTGSDFATGNVALLTGRGLRQSPLHRGTHRVTRLGIALREQPNLVYDRLACNKLFRRSFWTGHGLRFPEGVRYEDIPVTIPAYARARAVDVIELPVYYWRQRPADAPRSISQRQGELRNVVDRFAAVRSASRSLASLADRELKQWYDETALRSDLRMFLDLLPDVDDGYRRRFVELAADFLAGVDDRVIARLSPRLRVAWRLARDRALPELLDVVAAGRHGAVPAVVRRGLGRYLDLPLLDAGHPAAPRRLFRAPAGIHTEVHEARWTGDRLRIRGLAYDVSRPASRPWHPVRLLWLRAATGRWRRVVPLPTRVHRTGGVGGPVPYAWAGFSVSVDPRRLRGRAGWATGEWSFHVAVLRAGRPRRRMLAMGEARPALPARWVADGVRMVPEVRAGRLWLRVQRPGVWVTGVRVAADALLVEGGSVRPLRGATLWLARVAGVPARGYPVRPDGAGTRWSARVALADLVAGSAVAGRPVLVGEAGAGWRVAVAGPDGQPVELPVVADFAGVRRLAGGVELIARPTDDEVLWLRALPPGPVASGADLAGGVLSLTGHLPPGGPESGVHPDRTGPGDDADPGLRSGGAGPGGPGDDADPGLRSGGAGPGGPGGPGDGADPGLRPGGSAPAFGSGWADLRILLRRRETGGPAEVPPPDIVVPTEVSGGRWTARIRLTGATAPPDGDWAPLYRRRPDDAPVDLAFDVSARRLLPRDVHVGGRRLELLADRDRETLRLGPRPTA